MVFIARFGSVLGCWVLLFNVAFAGTTTESRPEAASKKVDHTAPSDYVHLEYASKQRSTIVYATNNHPAKSVRATVGMWVHNLGKGSKRLPDKIVLLYPGQRRSIGSTQSGNDKYTYRVLGGSFLP